MAGLGERPQVQRLRLLVSGPAEQVRRLRDEVRGEGTELSLDRILPVPPELRYHIRHGSSKAESAAFLGRLAAWRGRTWGTTRDLQLHPDDITVVELGDQLRLEYDLRFPGEFVPPIEEELRRRHPGCRIRLTRQRFGAVEP